MVEGDNGEDGITFFNYCLKNYEPYDGINQKGVVEIEEGLVDLTYEGVVYNVTTLATYSIPPSVFIYTLPDGGSIIMSITSDGFVGISEP